MTATGYVSITYSNGKVWSPDLNKNEDIKKFLDLDDSFNNFFNPKHPTYLKDNGVEGVNFGATSRRQLLKILSDRGWQKIADDNGLYITTGTTK